MFDYSKSNQVNSQSAHIAMTTLRYFCSGLLVFILLLFGLQTQAQSQKGKSFRNIDVGTNINALAFDPSGEYFASNEGGDIKLWYVKTWDVIPFFRAQNVGDVSSLAFTPDGKYLVSGGKDMILKKWDISDSKNVKYFNMESIQSSAPPDRSRRNRRPKTDQTKQDVEPSITTAMAINAPEDLLITGHLDNSVRVWDLASCQLIKVLSDQHRWTVSSVATVSDAAHSYVASASGDGQVYLWDMKRNYKRSEFTEDRSQSYVVAFSSDGRNLVTAGKDSMILWDLNNMAVVRKYDVGAVVSRLAYSPPSSVNQSEFIATGGEDGVIKLWMANADKPAIIGHHDRAIKALSFSPTGRSLVSTDGDSIKLWHLGDYLDVRILYGDQIEKDIARSPKLSPEKGEFETQEAYKQRLADRQYYIDEIIKKYANKVPSTYSHEQGQGYLKYPVDLKIDSIGRYHPENKDQYFMMNLQVVRNWRAKGKSYPAIEDTFRIPRQHAKSFKENYQRATAQGTAFVDRKTGQPVDVYDIVITHPTNRTTYPTQRPSPRGEFETSQAFKARKHAVQSYIDSVMHLSTGEATYADSLEVVRKSFHKVDLKIDLIGRYHPDPGEEYFYMKLSVLKNKKYRNGFPYPPITGNFKVPLADAKSFKANYVRARITAEVQYLEDCKSVDVFNFRFYHPDGKTVYPLQKIKKPLYFDENENEDSDYFDPNAKG